MKQQPTAIEILFVVVFLLLGMQIETGLSSPYVAETDQGSIAASMHITDVLLESSVEAVGFALIFLRWRQMERAIKVVWPLLGIVAIAFASCAWSARPTLTLRRCVLFLISTLIGIYIGERFSLEKQLRTMAYMFAGMMIAVFILRVVAPPYVVDYVSHPGAWKGLSGYKNAFGQYMAISFLIFFLVRFKKLDWMRYVFLVMSLVLLRFAESAASLVCCGLVIIVMPAWRSTHVKDKQKPAVYALITLVMLAGMFFFATHQDRFYGALGKNSSLTGRTQLWPAVWEAVMMKPVLGWGYDTFWASASGVVMAVRQAAGWMAQRSDNGFLDLLLGLGFVGMFAFLFFWIVSFKKALAYLEVDRSPLGLWPVTYLLFFLIHNMAESTLMTRGTFPDAVFVMIATSLALQPRRAAAPVVTRGAYKQYAMATPRT
jgi:exopolysaccharide production protein ExoQ